jgi:carbamate kinase
MHVGRPFQAVVATKNGRFRRPEKGVLHFFTASEGAELPERQWSAFLPHKMQTAFQKLVTSTTASPQQAGKTVREHVPADEIPVPLGQFTGENRPVPQQLRTLQFRHFCGASFQCHCWV